MNADELKAWLGKSRTAARRVMAEYVRKLPVDVRLTGDPKLQALARHHPTRKFPAEPVFVLRRRPPYFTLALCAEARTGGYVDFSWVRCVENLYGAFSRDKVDRANILSALRNEAHASGAMRKARAGLGDTCDRCKAKCAKLVVDHADMPFAQIVDEFLAKKHLDLMQLKVRGSRGHGFRLRKLGRDWRRFHDSKATLVGLCARCNGSLGSRGYRHATTKAPAVDADGAVPGQ
jgi:hypothetical protein